MNHPKAIPQRNTPGAHEIAVLAAERKEVEP
jgi:hypothetical protein